MEGRLLIRRAALFDGAFLGLFDVVVAGDRLAQLTAPGELPTLAGDWEVEAGGRAVVPGFVDGHTHLHRFLGRELPRGMGPGQSFDERLTAVRLPFERALTAADVGIAARSALAEAARVGTTCVFDHLHCPAAPADGLDAIAAAAEEIGVRVVASHACADYDGKSAASEALGANASFARSVAAHPRARGMIGLEASFVASDQTLARAATAARAAGVGLHVHVGEDELDMAQTFARHNRRPVHRLGEAGLLGELTLIAHGLTVDAAEAEALAQARAVAALTPRAVHTSARATRMEALTRTGVGLALGTDGLAADVRQEHVIRPFGPRSGREAVATVERELVAARHLAARLFGGVSALAPGGLADLVILDYRPLDVGAPPQAALQQILAAPVSWTIVGGRVVVREGKLLTADQAALDARARESAARLKLAVLGASKSSGEDRF